MVPGKTKNKEKQWTAALFQTFAFCMQFSESRGSFWIGRGPVVICLDPVPESRGSLFEAQGLLVALLGSRKLYRKLKENQENPRKSDLGGSLFSCKKLEACIA